jgi:hypothetical protein
MTKILSNKSNIDLDYPICRPSLDLDFTQEVLDPRITFSRGSIGTRVNRNRLIETVSADQPRFDYDPVTGECKGLLIEESRTNLLLQSESIDTANWNKVGGGTGSTPVVNANTAIAPDGTSTADQVVLALNGGTTVNDISYITQSYTSTSGTTYTVSIWLRTISGNVIISFDADSQTSNTITVTPVWQRFSFARTSSSTASRTVRFGLRGTFNTVNSATFYAWGAQLEVGAFPTSYIPTTASTVLRSVDNASMTGTNFSSWYNQTEGTFYSTIKSTTGIGGYIIIARGVSSGDRHQLTQTGGATVASSVVTALFSRSNNNQNKNAYSYSTNNFSSVSDKDRIGQDIFGSIPTNITYATIGRADFGGVNPINGTISRLTYYPRALKPNQLQYLTQ